MQTMSLPPSWSRRLKALQPPAGVNGYQASFIYCVHGKPLRGSAYPPVTVLYRREHATYQQDGHTQRVVISGETRQLHSPILHDDRKPLERWVASQLSYSALEAQRIASRDSYRFRDRLRELGVMPVIAGALAYIRAGGPFRGAAAVRYAYERAAYESLLAIRLMSLKLEAKQKTTTEAVPLQTPKQRTANPEQGKHQRSEVRGQKSAVGGQNVRGRKPKDQESVVRN